MKKKFSYEEAHRRVGRRIRTNVDFSGVPKGTEGKVVNCDGARGQGYLVVIEWDLPERTKPLQDWFTKDEYEKYLQEL